MFWPTIKMLSFLFKLTPLNLFFPFLCMFNDISKYPVLLNFLWLRFLTNTISKSKSNQKVQNNIKLWGCQE